MKGRRADKDRRRTKAKREKCCLLAPRSRPPQGKSATKENDENTNIYKASTCCSEGCKERKDGRGRVSRTKKWKEEERKQERNDK